MDALIATYGDNASSDSDSDIETWPAPPSKPPALPSAAAVSLPPPPLSLVNLPNSLPPDYLQAPQPSSRVRSFPHVEGNYAVHVYIPVYISGPQRKEIGVFVKRVASVVPGLFAVDVDVPLETLFKDDCKFEQVVLGREFHISLGRTVPIRFHQIDPLVAMLRQKIRFHKKYQIDFNKWEIFVNDEGTRTFLSIEVLSRGLIEVRKQIHSVNEVYRLHSLPEFYKDARPHISLAWALGDMSHSLRSAVEDNMRSMSFEGSSQRCIFTSSFNGIKCKIGKKTYDICKPSDE